MRRIPQLASVLLLGFWAGGCAFNVDPLGAPSAPAAPVGPGPIQPSSPPTPPPPPAPPVGQPDLAPPPPSDCRTYGCSHGDKCVLNNGSWVCASGD